MRRKSERNKATPATPSSSSAAAPDDESAVASVAPSALAVGTPAKKRGRGRKSLIDEAAVAAAAASSADTGTAESESEAEPSSSTAAAAAVPSTPKGRKPRASSRSAKAPSEDRDSEPAGVGRSARSSRRRTVQPRYTEVAEDDEEEYERQLLHEQRLLLEQAERKKREEQAAAAASDGGQPAESEPDEPKLKSPRKARGSPAKKKKARTLAERLAAEDAQATSDSQDTGGEEPPTGHDDDVPLAVVQQAIAVADVQPAHEQAVSVTVPDSDEVQPQQLVEQTPAEPATAGETAVVAMPSDDSDSNEPLVVRREEPPADDQQTDDKPDDDPVAQQDDASEPSAEELRPSESDAEPTAGESIAAEAAKAQKPSVVAEPDNAPESPSGTSAANSEQTAEQSQTDDASEANDVASQPTVESDESDADELHADITLVASSPGFAEMLESCETPSKRTVCAARADDDEDDQRVPSDSSTSSGIALVASESNTSDEVGSGRDEEHRERPASVPEKIAHDAEDTAPESPVKNGASSSGLLDDDEPMPLAEEPKPAERAADDSKAEELDDGNASGDSAAKPAKPAKPVQRKRKWLSTAAASAGDIAAALIRQPIVAISSDTMRTLIEDVRPLPLAELKLDSSPEPEECQPKAAKKSEDSANAVVLVADQPNDASPKKPTKPAEPCGPIVVAVPGASSAAGGRKVIDLHDSAKPLSPAKNTSTAILFITNLVRPFTVQQLKALLSRTGKLCADGFWIDKIKSKCYVQYETEDEAIETRHALHGVRWPTANPKCLHVEFSSEQTMRTVIETIPGADGIRPTVNAAAAPNVRDERIVSGEPGSGGVWERFDPDEQKDKPTKRSVREWDLGKRPGLQTKDADGTTDGGKERATDGERRKRSAERGTQARSVSTSPARKSNRKETDVQVRLLDDLFRKTKATPCIYWLPLTAEQISVKEEARRVQLAQHKRTLDEAAQKEKERLREREKARERDRERDRRGGGSSAAPAAKSSGRDRSAERNNGRNNGRDRSTDRRDRDRDRSRRSKSRERGGDRRRY